MAGSYTPFIVLNIKSDFKYFLLALVWSIAAGGVAYKLFSKFKTRFLSVCFYIAFGFLCFAVKGEFLDLMPATSFNYLAYGGAMYVSGIFAC